MGIFDVGRYKEIEDGEIFRDLNRALDTQCYICGEVLEWSAKMLYDEINDRPILEITSGSCGKRFKIIPLEVMTLIDED